MSEKLSQKDAVTKAIEAVRDEAGKFERKAVIDELMLMFDRGEFDIGSPEKKATEKARRDYLGSLLSNWLRRDPRLSGRAAPASSDRRRIQHPADDEMKRLFMAKVVLLKDGLPTEEIDALIAQRSAEIMSQRGKGKEEAEAQARALLASESQTSNEGE